MKGTDFYKLYRELQAREMAELVAAVNAHDGSYVFFDCNTDNEGLDEIWEEEKRNCPMILASSQYDETYSDFYVTKVELTSPNCVDIYGVRAEYGVPLDEDVLDCIHIGHTHYITEDIPETSTVKDVTIKFS